MEHIPTKLKSDGIRESLFEIRFHPTPSPDLTVANLLSIAASFFEGARVERLPIADIPAPIRQADPNLAFQAIHQVVFPNNRLIRLGEQVVSYHAVTGYPGWPAFKSELEKAFAIAREKTKGVRLVGFGLRYLNMLTEQQHNASISDLNLHIDIGGAALEPPVTIAYRRHQDNRSLDVRIASAEFVAGIARDFNTLVDLDVRSTDEATLPQTVDGTLDWLEKAHTQLKEEFFRLLKTDVVERLRG